MGSTTNIKRFKTNPVEVVIFLAVTGVFANSVYNLFYDSRSFKPAALTPMAANPVSEGRSPASLGTTPTFQNIEIQCEQSPEQSLSASKIRLVGKLCGTGTEGNPVPSKMVINNTVNQFNATVFTDTTAGRFSTDYIPLNPGKNPLRIEFNYSSGKSFSQDLILNRN